ncbi:hypothetical protein BDA99DRAFT_496977 [Phascolomyces articulosus]|uniref:Uncharacterized protein n=1 Tax=Phascolomyces articulosus TaxID=60185 RepID=A0AAD5KNK5_9FUNG|nr:hypothetical protein BDA99DRAFT_496977 [Phascolomyces articulosus]
MIVNEKATKVIRIIISSHHFLSIYTCLATIVFFIVYNIRFLYTVTVVISSCFYYFKFMFKRTTNSRQNDG